MATLQGPAQTFGGGVSDAHTTPFPHAVGTRARDSEGNEYVYVDYTGNAAPEMVVVISPSFTASGLTTGSYGAIGVVPDFPKLGQSSLTPTIPGSYQWTSDNAGWVQVYGRATIGFGNVASDADPSDGAAGITTLRTSAEIKFLVPTSVATPGIGVPLITTGIANGSSGVVVITGMWLATDFDVSGAQVSGLLGNSGGSYTTASEFPSWHAAARCAVWLNYPYTLAQSLASNV